ncbi:MAG TPA: asparagine synthase (glutamine-hydrolyzing) [Burkholderiales bacterium]|nr:asparagine synthase (glutamine-hydrolyzing) [Burkholderiales bacterium]
MCGIAGWIAAAHADPGEEALGRMLDAIAHRGPDDAGTWLLAAPDGRRVALGHRRLAIIAPEAARQPMRDAAAGLALTFNGEIYNFRELRDELAAFGYRFALDSDTEVLLRAYQHWGQSAVQHLRGMFAFAIWDARNQRLFLARDRFGEKPLFLHCAGGDLYFASEIKALLELPCVKAQVDFRAVWDYLAYRYVPAPWTLFSGIRKLMPGCTAVWERGHLRETRYWAPPDGQALATGWAGGTAEAVAAFLGQLDEAVKLQMVSDVPFGAFLSGGLDSSAIVGLMSRHSSRVRTFSAGFAERAYSELGHAAEVAKHFGTEHHEVVVAERDLIEQLPKLTHFRDAPVSEPADVPMYLLACEAARSVKMVLSGEGSDELLAGYPKHMAERFVAAYQSLPLMLRRRLLEPLAQALPYRFRRLKTAAATLALEDWRERYVRWFGALTYVERETLSALRPRGAPPAPFGPPFDAQPGASALRRMLYFDQTSWLPDNLLERGDRMTMAASIESRAPFLDHRLAQMVSTLPDDFRVRGLRSKWILREAAKRLLPRRILERPKVGFRVPVNEWFRGRIREFLLDHLGNGRSLTRPYYDAKLLDRVLGDHMRGRQNHEKLIWALLNLEIWHRQYA